MANKIGKIGSISVPVLNLVSYDDTELRGLINELQEEMQDCLINVTYDSASKEIIFTKKDGSLIKIKLEFDTAELEEEITELTKKVNSCIKTVSYDANTGILTFTKTDGKTETVDLPLELLINSGTYDNTNKQIVLTLANLDTITIPIGDILTEIYTKDEITQLLLGKQDTLTQGEGINISEDGIISSTSGTNILIQEISGNVTAPDYSKGNAVIGTLEIPDGYTFLGIVPKSVSSEKVTMYNFALIGSDIYAYVEHNYTSKTYTLTCTLLFIKK
jgi:hypothetical protein